MKDMMAALNEMLERHERGRGSAASRSSWSEYGDFFPENPQTLEELLESMAQRMAAMQAMLNSMTPEQRAQLQQLADQLLEDMDLRWQVDQLGQNLQRDVPAAGLAAAATTCRARTRSGSGRRCRRCRTSATSTSSSTLLRNATSPGELAEADMDRVRDLLGDDAARSLEQLAELAKMLEEAGLIENKEGRLELTPKGLRKIGSNALRDLFSKLAKDKMGQHEIDAPRRRPRAHVRDEAVRVRRPVPPRSAPHDPQRAAPQRRRHARAAARPTTSRSSARRTSRKSSTVLMLDLSLSMPMRDNFLAGEEGGDGAALADHVAVPARLPRHRRLQRGRPAIIQPQQLPEVQLGLRLRHEHAARVRARRASCSPARPARSRSS